MKKRVIVLDDTCQSGNGGTALTLTAIAETLSDLEFTFIETRKLAPEALAAIPTSIPWVIGNVQDLTYDAIKSLYAVLQFRKFIKVEFDYGFCKFRCKQGYKKFTGEPTWNVFDGPNGSVVLKNIYNLSHTFAQALLFMSEEQMEIHEKKLSRFFDVNKNMAVLGSCFSPKHMMSMLNAAMHRKPKIDKKLYAIVDGNGGWHSEAKGVNDSIAHCRKNKLDFQVIHENNYERFLELLSSFDGTVFLPFIHDTCPRLTIETKLLGMELITNDNSQHISEKWFSLPPEEMANYLLERPYVLRNELEKILWR